MKEGIGMIENNKYFKGHIEYLNSEGVNFHTLYEVWKYSLNHFKSKDKEPTSNLILGQIIHMYLLEKINIDELVLVMPKLDKRKKEDKQIYEEIIEKSKQEYKYIIDEEEYYNILNMYENFYDILSSYKEFNNINYAINNGKKEFTFYYDEYIDNNKIKIKSRIDCVYENYIMDLKSTINASEKNFIKDIYNYGYDLQLTFYAYGLSKIYNIDIKEFRLFILAIEKSLPYDMNIYEIPIRQNNIEIIENMMRKYLYQINNPKHAGYEKKIIVL